MIPKNKKVTNVLNKIDVHHVERLMTKNLKI